MTYMLGKTFTLVDYRKKEVVVATLYYEENAELRKKPIQA